MNWTKLIANILAAAAAGYATSGTWQGAAAAALIAVAALFQTPPHKDAGK